MCEETIDTILKACSTVVIILGIVKFLSIVERMHDLNEECEQLEQEKQDLQELLRKKEQD